eukprot:4830894-Amphidinium_carterae.1
MWCQGGICPSVVELAASIAIWIKWCCLSPVVVSSKPVAMLAQGWEYRDPEVVLLRSRVKGCPLPCAT